MFIKRENALFTESLWRLYEYLIPVPFELSIKDRGSDGVRNLL
jgi:hypothetical protein